MNGKREKKRTFLEFKRGGGGGKLFYSWDPRPLKYSRLLREKQEVNQSRKRQRGTDREKREKGVAAFHFFLKRTLFPFVGLG